MYSLVPPFCQSQLTAGSFNKLVVIVVVVNGDMAENEWNCSEAARWVSMVARRGRQSTLSDRIGSMQVYNTLNRCRQVSWQCYTDIGSRAQC